MKHLTRVGATALATLVVSLGVVAAAAPAQAFSDSSWGWVKTPVPAQSAG